jgi:hypothetical protein
MDKHIIHIIVSFNVQNSGRILQKMKVAVGKILWKMGLYVLCRKTFHRKQFFTSEDAAKVRMRGKSSFEKIFFGEEEHNRKMYY